MKGEIYLILLLTHLVSDFMFQPREWALNKQKNFFYLLIHSLQYTIIFSPVFYFLKINFLWLLYLFATHVVVDSGKIVFAFNKYIKREYGKRKPPFWLLVVQDQILHLLLLLPLA